MYEIDHQANGPITLIALWQCLNLRPLIIWNNQDDLWGFFQANANHVQINFVIQNIKTPNVINRSIPEGIKARVLMSRAIKLTDNKIFKQDKNTHPIFGAMVKIQTPTSTKIPLLKPMISEILLPFLNPRKPPKIKNRP